MRDGKLAADVKPEPRSGHILETGLLSSAKGLEDRLAHPFGDPDAVVVDTNLGARSLERKPDQDASRPCCIDQRVVEQVVDQMTELACIGHHLDSLVWNLHRDLPTGQARPWARSLHRGLHHPPQVELFAPRHHSPLKPPAL